jgi:putative spermidine/putrescine transport system ATP-binding protein
MAALVCAGVGVRDGAATLLDEVDLTVRDGSVCVVMGPSGAGKSTLLRAVAGLVAHRGRIALDDRDLDGVAPHRRGVGLLFQRPRLFPTMSVLDNVAYPLRVRGVPRRRRREHALALLDEVGLADRASERPGHLSGGEQQRVAVARALCFEPAVLLLDEPLTGLDVPQRRDLIELLHRVRSARRLTWVVVTHDPDDAAALGDTIAVLDRGRLVQHDTVEVMRARPRSGLVAALVDNRNLLRGEVRNGVLQVGPLKVPVSVADGRVSCTLDAGRVELEGPIGNASRLEMRVEGIEWRGPHRMLRVVGDVGVIEIPTTRAQPVGSSIDVWIDPDDLWLLSEPGRHDAAVMSQERAS